ncbi:MAG: RHS repeat-associated core domain-containing protein [Acholeplasmataceae bacterium]|nr:RHS repeat-associated core domain-containing protein [Acholeplasmataceae bacterium]
MLLEKTGNDVIYYTYDADGSILSMNYLGDEYFYIKNLQGDIIEVVDASGTTVAKYRYDAWGNIVYQWDSGLGIANANPYRYRSYRFDSGTGLYYLNARYYDPSIGRFISADSINYLDPSSGQGLNLYAYCGNNPVMFTDSTGYWFGFDDIVTGPIDEILVLGLLIVAAVIGIPGAADALDDLTGVLNNTFNSVREKINEAKKAIPVMIVLAITSVQKKSNTGAYAIQFSDGNYYIGKGSQFRMYMSAMREGLLHGSTPISFRYEYAASDRDAYKKEYMWMVDYGYYTGTQKMYNRIWSPGRLYYYLDNGSLYSDDYLGR